MALRESLLQKLRVCMTLHFVRVVTVFTINLKLRQDIFTRSWGKAQGCLSENWDHVATFNKILQNDKPNIRIVSSIQFVSDIVRFLFYKTSYPGVTLKHDVSSR